MKILLRPRLCSAPLARDIASDPELARALGAKENGALGPLFTRFFDASGPLLPTLLSRARAHGERMSFLRSMTFGAADLDAASHLEVVCRVTVGQSRGDADRTRAAYREEPLQPTASRWHVRLPGRIYLTKAPPPDTIAHVDQWTGEYVCGAEAARSLRASGLRGAMLQPVLQPRTEGAHPLVEHLTTRELLPAALQDATTFETFDDGRGQPSQPRRYGLLSYAAGDLATAPDLARTAEPWGEWRTPTWVVRQDVRRWFVAGKLRGWAFLPVLEAGTRLHEQHVSGWKRLLDTLAAEGAEILA